MALATFRPLLFLVSRNASSILAYGVATAVAVAVTAASIPLYTYSVPQAEFGRYALFVAWSTMLTPLIQAGLPQASVRFFHDTRWGSTYFPTLNVTALIVSTAAALVVTMTLGLLGLLDRLALLALPLFLTATAVNELFLAYLRAAERAYAYAVVAAGRRLFVFALTAVTFVKSRDAGFAVLMMAAAESLFAIATALGSRDWRAWRHFDSTLAREAMKFGFWHAANTLAIMVLSMADRLVVERQLGAAMLAAYVVPYTIAAGIVDAVSRPFNLAVFPSYSRAWNESGAEVTRRRLHKWTSGYLVAVIPIAVMAYWWRRELMRLFAPANYDVGIGIFPWVLGSTAIFGLSSMLFAGLYVTSRAWVAVLSSSVAAVLNIVLTLVLVPRLGLIGAAMATAIGYTTYVAVGTIAAFQTLSFRLPLRTGVAAASLALLLASLIYDRVPDGLWILEPVGFLLVFGAASGLVAVWKPMMFSQLASPPK